MDQIDALVSGFLLGLTLIVAIGAQNAFVLRQGLVRQHVLVVTTICFVSDGLLISAGVLGLGTMVKQSPLLLKIVTIGGAGFLLFYGGLALARSFRKESLAAAERDNSGLGATTLVCLAITWGNPHVYLDTVVLLGSLSARFSGTGQLLYAIGGIIASGIWFYGLGYGARFLAPIFSKPAAWRILDLAICLVMWGIAAKIVIDFVLV